VAAHEQDRQRVVEVRHPLTARFLRRRGRLPRASRPLAAVLVDQPPLGGLNKPPARIFRDAFLRPTLRGREQRLLDRVFRCDEVAESSREDAEDLRRELAQQILDVGGNIQLPPPACCAYSFISAASEGASSMIRRTWIGCCNGTPFGPGTAETRAAISSARSSESTSTIW
jgi:hypothetical protein